MLFPYPKVEEAAKAAEEKKSALFTVTKLYCLRKTSFFGSLLLGGEDSRFPLWKKVKNNRIRHKRNFVFVFSRKGEKSPFYESQIVSALFSFFSSLYAIYWFPFVKHSSSDSLGNKAEWNSVDIWIEFREIIFLFFSVRDLEIPQKISSQTGNWKSNRNLCKTCWMNGTANE